MIIQYKTHIRIYDEETGKINADGGFSIEAEGDARSIEYFKNAISVMNDAMGNLINETEL